MFKPLSYHSSWVTSVAFVSDDAYIVSASHDCTIRIWDSMTGKALGEPLRGHSAIVSSLAISPYGAHIASGSRDNSAFITTIKGSEHDSWKQNCRRMDAADGWIKDGEKLILWVPTDYRHWFRGNIDVWIRGGLSDQQRRPPKVDLDLLRKFSGKQWTRVYIESKVE